MESSRINYTAVGAVESVRMHRVVERLMHGDDTAVEIDRLVTCAREHSATSFEQYIGSIFLSVGADKLLERWDDRRLKVLAPGDGHLARIVASAAARGSDSDLVEAAETALNRVVSIVDAIDDGHVEGAPDTAPERISISFLGVDPQQSQAGYRSAQVVLPRLPHGESPTASYYNEIDWRALDGLASIARSVFQQSLVPNLRQSVLGACAPNKSDWDVRTRLAMVLSGLELPFRCRFRFDCDVQAHTIWVHFDMPPTYVLPDVMLGDDEMFSATSARQKKAALSESAYRVLALRFACLVAAACFGGGRDIQQVNLNGMDGSWTQPRLTCVFQRDRFVKSVLAAIDAGTFVSPSLRYSPEAFASLIQADTIEWAEGVRMPRQPQSTHTPGGSEVGARRNPWEDDRLLSEDAQLLFRCKRVSDIDASHYFGPHAELVDEAKRDSSESLLAAIVRLESIVAELEEKTFPPDDNADARPLYCPHALARLAVGLLNDEMSVGAQAESFLNNGTLTELREADLPWYFRAPSALFHAHMGLSDLYQRMGDFRGAEAHADRCIELAPTTADSYYRKADILAEQHFYTQAANVLTNGLRFAATQKDSSLLYYYLGLLMWNLGMRRHATAIHVYNASLQGEFAEKSNRIVEGMKKRGDAHVIAYASPIAASQEMARLRIPQAPIDLRCQVAAAVISLCNANQPAAAAPYAAALARYCRNDEVIVAACQSIQRGTQLTC